jgi:UDP-GlcNAc:undecaprenyl-phosphate GlcNAc-1-phosphate transferase
MLAIAFILSASIASAIMPAIIAYASRKGLFDTIDPRKIHDGKIPRLGGIAIFLAYLLSVAVFALLARQVLVDYAREARYWPILVGMFMVFFLGLVDDIKNIPALAKLAVQVLSAAIVVGFGFRFGPVSIPFWGGKLELGIWSWPLSLLWIVGVTNAMNLIDGLDGLAGGIAAIAAATFGLFYLARGSVSSAVLCFALAGACSGFLLFNWPKAKIFMGDAGSLFIGFSLSVLPLLEQSVEYTEIGLISSIVVLGIPILDTLAAMWRRTRGGIHFFAPDKGHIHHILLNRGFGNWEILKILYTVTIILSCSALSSLYLSLSSSFLFKIVSLLVLLCGYVYVNLNQSSIAG